MYLFLHIQKILRYRYLIHNICTEKQQAESE